MTSDSQPLLLVVDDDPEDLLLVRTAVKRAHLPLVVKGLQDGESLMGFVKNRNSIPDPLNPSMVILLDLNMPGKDGRSCLREIKQNTQWADIPIIIFSTSDSPEDIQNSYELHANSYICKPDDLIQLERILVTLYRYWFGPSMMSTQEAPP
ncbi:MAG: response regulator [Saccharospirillum sp.]|nr:response regulator [Saccharospirillum sp.]